MDVGDRLGPYRIDALIGAGGMGQVFRGTDTRLDRSVAIKVSREEFSARFTREARTIAQLNHPHICTLHDVGQTYLVMEFVEGDTLAAVLQKGPLPISVVLKYGTQIANALAAAHAKGIVHRDLKPQNVMITRNGVKVLDFGLAKVPDETLTGLHAVLGTPAYMAPEQREGKATDPRTDIYALGLVLREMATGNRERGAVSIELPSQFVRILEHCLAADPEERWQSARDLAGALEIIAEVPRFAVPKREVKTLARRVPVVVGLILLAVAIGYWMPTKTPERLSEFSILPPDGTSFLTLDQAGPPALSPDGKQIAFAAAGSAGRLLWIRSLDVFDARPLPGTEGAGSPFWSPDGRSLGFIADGSLRKIDIAGGQPQVLATFGALAGTWNDAGTILFSRGTNTIYSVSASGGEPEQVTEKNIDRFEENHFTPHFLPDGKHYLLLVRAGAELEYQVWLAELGSSERHLLLNRATNARYAPPRAGAAGYLLFVRDRKLMAQPFDANALKLTGDPVLLAERVAVSSAGGGGDFSVSPEGVLAYRLEEPVKQELVWYDLDGKVVGSIGNSAGNPRNNVRISPDGNSVAFTRQGGDTQDVWVHDSTRGVASRLTFGGGRSPVWSPDGSQIVFLRKDTIYRKAVSGTGSEVALWSGSGVLSANDWSGDGRYILITRWDVKIGRGLWLLPNPLDDADRHEPQMLESPALHGQFAPANGPPRWIAFDNEEANIRQVYVRTMPGQPAGRWQVSTVGGNAARWRRDGRELYFLSGAGFVVVDVDASPPFRFGPPHPLFAIPRGMATAATQYAPGYDAAPDGKQFLATFPAGEIPSAAINVVVNWQLKLVN